MLRCSAQAQRSRYTQRGVLQRLQVAAASICAYVASILFLGPFLGHSVLFRPLPFFFITVTDIKGLVLDT